VTDRRRALTVELGEDRGERLGVPPPGSFCSRGAPAAPVELRSTASPVPSRSAIPCRSTCPDAAPISANFSDELPELMTRIRCSTTTPPRRS